MIKPYTEYRGFDNDDISAMYHADSIIRTVRNNAHLTDEQREKLGDALTLLDAMMDRHEVER